MQRCEKCGVSLAGSHTFCPLCQGPVTGAPQPEDEIFPVVPLKGHRLWIRVIAFISIAIAGICLAINLAFPSGGWWSLFVIAGLACLWLSGGFAVVKRRNIPKDIVWQVVILSSLAIGWDHFTGNYKWSVNYVVPLLCTFAILSMMIIGKIMKIKVSDYLVYLILNILFGTIPFLFLLLKWATVAWPSLICITVSLLSLAGLAVFRGNSLLSELHRRTHL